MVNGRSRRFLYRSYICGVQKSLNDMFEQLRNLKSTSSISADFINQFLIYQKLAEKTAKNTAVCTNFKPVFDMASEIAGKRCELLNDIKKIKIFCSNFKNCSADIRNYYIGFRKICDNYCSILKDIENGCNINIFFLKFMIQYNNFSVLLNKNVLRYRICPQLRLISEYGILLSKKENIKITNILNS